MRDIIYHEICAQAQRVHESHLRMHAPGRVPHSLLCRGVDFIHRWGGFFRMRDVRGSYHECAQAHSAFMNRMRRAASLTPSLPSCLAESISFIDGPIDRWGGLDGRYRMLCTQRVFLHILPS